MLKLLVSTMSGMTPSGAGAGAGARPIAPSSISSMCSMAAESRDESATKSPLVTPQLSRCVAETVGPDTRDSRIMSGSGVVGPRQVCGPSSAFQVRRVLCRLKRLLFKAKSGNDLQ